MFTAGLSGCGSPPADPVDWNAVDQEIDTVRTAVAVSVTPEQAAGAFALGSDSTDVQRDQMERQLVGAVVEWDLVVYEVDYQNGFYELTSQPLPGAGPDTVALLRVVALVRAQSDSDEQILRAIKTNETIRVRGRVLGIMLRTIVEMKPAVVVR